MPKLSDDNRARLVAAMGGRSQHELAAKVGCTQAAINKILNGKLAPSEDMMNALCEVLGLEWVEVPARVTIKRKGKG